MNIIPASAITRKITKLLEIDSANIIAADESYTDANSGLVLTFGGALSKDADGVYAGADYSLPTVAGTMPELSGHIAVISISKAPTAAATAASFIFGDSGIDGAAISSNGACFFNSSSQITGRTNVNLSINNANVAQCALFDFEDTSSPDLYYAHCNSTEYGQDIKYTTTTGTALISAPVSNVVAMQALSADEGERFKYAAVIRFDKKPSQQEIAAAVYEMQETGTLYSKWVAS